jgi:DTW domain-containing protein
VCLPVIALAAWWRPPIALWATALSCGVAMLAPVLIATGNGSRRRFAGRATGAALVIAQLLILAALLVDVRLLVPIGQYAGSDRPIVLVVPDGNWRQAGKMRRRVPGLAELPRVSLPAMPPTAYRLRAELREGGLATLEAIAGALAILEGERGPAIEAALLAVFRVMVDRTLWSRGALRDSEVTGGVPAAALARTSPPGT